MPVTPSLAGVAAGNARLERELPRAEAERDILKGAAAAIGGVDGPRLAASRCARVEASEHSTEGSHPWTSLSPSASIWPRASFRGSDHGWTRDRPPNGVDAEGRVVVRRRLRRLQVLAFFERSGPCLVGTEACSGARRRARELAGLGHEVRLMVSRDRGRGAAAQAR
jgi:hypothetical protein